MRTIKEVITSHSGFSLTGLMVAIGISGIVVLAGLQLFKNAGQVQMITEVQTGHQELQKQVETHLFTQEGCKGLVGASVGDNLSITTKSGKNFKAGAEFGIVSIKGITYSEFFSANEAGLIGIAKVKVVTTDRSGKSYPAEIPVPVNLAPDKKIESCNFYQRRALQEIADNLCGGAFGSLSKGKDCEEVQLMVMSMMVKSVCEDVYGTGGDVQLNGHHCNLEKVHAKKKCPTGQVMRGFNGQGTLECVSP